MVLVLVLVVVVVVVVGGGGCCCFISAADAAAIVAAAAVVLVVAAAVVVVVGIVFGSSFLRRDRLRFFVFAHITVIAMSTTVVSLSWCMFFFSFYCRSASSSPTQKVTLIA